MLDCRVRLSRLSDGGPNGIQPFLELGIPKLENPIKLLLLCFNNLCHTRCRINQLWIRSLHQIADGEDHLEKERLFLAEQTAMTNASAKNLPQHIAAAFVRGNYAVVDQESGSAGVVGDDAKAGVADEGIDSLRG